MALVKTPREGYSGEVVGVKFQNGEGMTADEGALAYFARQGYKIEPEPEPEPDAPKAKPKAK